MTGRSQATSWARWLLSGLVLASVVLATQWWPQLDWVITLVVLGLVVGRLAIWGIWELIDEIRDVADGVADTPRTRWRRSKRS